MPSAADEEEDEEEEESLEAIKRHDWKASEAFAIPCRHILAS